MCFSVAWIDYKKAYIVPHSQIKKILDALKKAGNLKDLLANGVKDEETVFMANGEVLSEGNIGKEFSKENPLLYLFYCDDNS